MRSYREFRELQALGLSTTASDVVVPKAARHFQGDRAGVVTRSLAAAADVALVGVSMLVLYAMIWLLLLTIAPFHANPMPDLIWFVPLGIATLWGYWTISWGISGRTFGGHLMGVRVIDYRGEQMNWPTAAVRSIFCVGLPVGLLWVVVSGANRSVQDLVLRTSVIHDWVMDLPPQLGQVPVELPPFGLV